VHNLHVSIFAAMLIYHAFPVILAVSALIINYVCFGFQQSQQEIAYG